MAAVVTCFCDQPVAISTSNTAANPGRQFERCAHYNPNNRCKYWEWCDDDQGLPALRCFCNRVARMSTAGAGAMGHNYGREFARCRHPEAKKRCKFFEWCDGQDSQELFNEYMDARLGLVG
ncbi:hypothetical protein B0H12DRAFT_1148273 [Mycena haematopus]|nr:hypothetical protein B0H12DRAFT_1148273 [Mycena haematopus]